MTEPANPTEHAPAERTSTDHVQVAKAAGICTITFNRPAKKNAFTVNMYERCVAALEDAQNDKDIRVVLFTGAGDAFTAGNDLADFMNNRPTSEDSPVFRFLLALLDYEKPIVVAVNGTAIGIGVTMLAHCDLVYAADHARFTAPFVSLGLVPEGGSSFLFPRMAGHVKANEALLLGEPFDAQTASDLGLVTRVVAASELADLARAKAARLAALPPAAMRESKKLLRGHTRDMVRKALHAEAVVFAARLESPEAIEAFSAFFEKRKPDFSSFE